MGLKHITLEDCIMLYEKHGWMAVIHNGRLVDFEKRKGTHGMKPKRASK